MSTGERLVQLLMAREQSAASIVTYAVSAVSTHPASVFTYAGGSSQ